MRQRRIVLLSCLCLLSIGAFADSITAEFTISANGTPVPSQGFVNFTLENNGSILASLTITNGFTILGFGFNSLAVDLPESNFSPVQPDNPYGWLDHFGYQASGFYCTQCGTTETWTIDGNYSSVSDVLDGGSQSLVDFFLLDSGYNEWGANPIPEPATWLVLSSGLLSMACGLCRRGC